MASLAEKILDVAPSIGQAIAGPMGGVVGTAARSVLRTVLGLKPGADDTAIETAIAAASPETLLALRKADQDFQTKMAEIGVDLERISADDRKSARDRQIALKDRTPELLSVLVVGGWMFIQWYAMTHQVADSMKDIVLPLLRTLDMALGMVLAYWFGSSSGSKQKTEALTAVATGKTNTD